MGLRAGLDEMEKRKFLTLPGLEHRPASSQSLYRLSWGIAKYSYAFLQTLSNSLFINLRTIRGNQVLRRKNNDLFTTCTYILSFAVILLLQ
jgi:hypothetical protein